MNDEHEEHNDHDVDDERCERVAPCPSSSRWSPPPPPSFSPPRRGVHHAPSSPRDDGEDAIRSKLRRDAASHLRPRSAVTTSTPAVLRSGGGDDSRSFLFFLRRSRRSDRNYGRSRRRIREEDRRTPVDERRRRVDDEKKENVKERNHASSFSLSMDAIESKIRGLPPPPPTTTTTTNTSSGRVTFSPESSSFEVTPPRSALRPSLSRFESVRRKVSEAFSFGDVDDPERRSRRLGRRVVSFSPDAGRGGVVVVRRDDEGGFLSDPDYDDPSSSFDARRRSPPLSRFESVRRKVSAAFSSGDFSVANDDDDDPPAVPIVSRSPPSRFDAVRRKVSEAVLDAPTSDPDLLAADVAVPPGDDDDDHRLPVADARAVSVPAVLAPDDDDGAAVLIVEVVDVEREARDRAREARRAVRRAAAAAVVVAIVVAVVVATLSPSGGGGGTLSPTSVRSAAPSDVPSAAPSSDRHQRLFATLTDAGATSDADANDPTSAGRRALRWLAYDDRYLVDDDDVAAVVQRYVAAVFYFSLGGDGWHLCARGSDCRCRHFVTKDGSAVNACGEVRGRAAHLDPDRHECEWFGIGCAVDDEGRDVITRIDFEHISNGLKGTLPSELRWLVHLQKLAVSQNPAFVADEEDRYRAYFNEIQGGLPEVLLSADGAPSLRSLTLSRVGLTGTLPDHRDDGNTTTTTTTTTSFPADLRVLDLSHNDLNGTLPASLFDGRRPRLARIDLSGNRFEGTIPDHRRDDDDDDDDSRRWTTLDSLRLRDNELRGTVPASLCSLVDDGTLRTLTTDCPDKVRCDCCGPGCRA